uniref:Uncharacterized protein n=1 Tax=Anguilla anguilla TaxID=7936 RepID=A0A0E9RWD6_ANGAN
MANIPSPSPFFLLLHSWIN